MFRANVLKELFKKSKHPYFSENECEDIISEYNENVQDYLKKYSFYPYEIWNIDYTFVCFMYTHLKALTEFHQEVQQLGDFPKEIEALTSRVEELLIKGYDFMDEKDRKNFNDVCKEFVRLLPGMWT